MPARRPNVPRAVRASPPALPRTADGVAGDNSEAPEAGVASERTKRTDGPRVATPSDRRAAERAELARSIRSGGAQARPAAPRAIVPAEAATPIPAKTFTGRLLALGVVLLAVTVLLAPSVSTYLAQQTQARELRADIARQQAAKDGYYSQLERWEDPAYIRQQARERIFMVLPGERRYLVEDGSGMEGTPSGTAEVRPEQLPWVDSLWDSVARAATG